MPNLTINNLSEVNNSALTTNYGLFGGADYRKTDLSRFSQNRELRFYVFVELRNKFKLDIATNTGRYFSFRDVLDFKIVLCKIYGLRESFREVEAH